MKTSTFLRSLTIVGLFIASTSASFAQVLTGSGTLVVTGAAGSGEEFDYVTEGSTMPYKVTPFDWGAYSSVMGTSDFKWTVTGTGATIYQDADAGTSITSGNYVNGQSSIRIAWPTPGSPTDFTLTVNERSKTALGATGCEGDATTLTVKLLPWPTFSFDVAADPSACGMTADLSLPIDVVGSKDIKVAYKVDYFANGGTTSTPAVAATSVTISGTGYNQAETGNITIPSTVLSGKFGKYVVTVTNVTDKITDKSFGAGYANPGFSTAKTYTFYNIPAPTTGPIQHIKNL